MNKENTFAKIVERTSKLSAYSQVLAWAKNCPDKDSVIWYLEQKIMGHKNFVSELDVDYNFATQSLTPKPKLGPTGSGGEK